MKRFCWLIMWLISLSSVLGQNLTDLIALEDYDTAIEVGIASENLTPIDWMQLGFAHYMIDQERKALSCYDSAEAHGLDTALLFYRRALAHRYLDDVPSALVAIDQALVRMPEEADYLSEKGFLLYVVDQNVEAYPLFEAARLQNPADSRAQFFSAFLLSQAKDVSADSLTAALENRLLHIPPEDYWYQATLEQLVDLYMDTHQDYRQAIRLLERLLVLDEGAYDQMELLIQAYYQLEEFGTGDSIFDILQHAYYTQPVTEQLREHPFVLLEEFTLEDERAIVAFRALDSVASPHDVAFRFYLLDEERNIDRILQTEKTFILTEDSPAHLLGEQLEGGHSTYPIGWSEDSLTYPNVKKRIVQVLEEGAPPGASTRYGNDKEEAANEDSKKSKRKRKRRRRNED